MKTVMRTAMAAIVVTAALALVPTSSSANPVAISSRGVSAGSDAPSLYVSSSDDETFPTP